MMTEPPKSGGGDEMCPICNKLKSQHKPEEIVECSKKIRDFYDAKEDRGEK